MQPNAEPVHRARTLILIHGGSHKPEREALEALWREALLAGLDRDHAEQGGRSLLAGVNVRFVYYGDLVNPLCVEAGAVADEALDLEDRRHDLERLARLSAKKKFRRVHYEAVPGKSALGELVADMVAPLAALGLTPSLLARRMPALAAYLSDAGGLREQLEARLLEPLAAALDDDDNVMLISHGLGSVVSYDALWRLSHEAGRAPTSPPRRVRVWITLGSPLASDYVRQRLRGAGELDEGRYPNRIINWYNVAAEDDYVCHDKTVADDFAGLLKQHQLSLLRDYRIYNLAIRYGRSNPHNAVGYLIHPRVARLLADWLQEPVS